ncbi:hypothetical protein HGM15179_003487 [Zosterops borbonicus]|uniref:Uncharacterized protein n=1 Tax=Zosterops borbonicus TaxID=364589 RepID=A0A8K1GUH6_9PASS|nr:hypothetical protein HGM15179_003487 [Zosterops borbonicus]
MKSPSLETYKSHLDMFLCHLLQMTLPCQGVRLDGLQRSIPTLTILCFCDRQDCHMPLPFSLGVHPAASASEQWNHVTCETAQAQSGEAEGSWTASDALAHCDLKKAEEKDTAWELLPYLKPEAASLQQRAKAQEPMQNSNLQVKHELDLLPKYHLPRLHHIKRQSANHKERDKVLLGLPVLVIKSQETCRDPKDNSHNKDLYANFLSWLDIFGKASEDLSASKENKITDLVRSRWIIKGTWHGIDVKMKSREQISGSSLSGKCSIDHEDYQKKGPPFLTHAVNINGFRKSGMTFACGSAYMVSYYCTMKSLPSSGWRKLFPSSSMPPGSCGISKAEFTPLSCSLIPHIIFMLDQALD